MTALYNEIDSYAAQWLRNLVTAGHIAPGVVDERSIKDLAPADVAGRGQRHFFAGIAGWSLALRLAGVPDNANVWTGSCPCQPFSDAGRGGGFDDDRHLWPVWFRLIRECRPALVFGEQVASRAGLTWLDAVHADMEGAGYTVRAADLCAASVGAPHRRQRLFFVAYTDGQQGRLLAPQWEPGRADAKIERRGEVVGMADSNGGGRDRRTGDVSPRTEQSHAARSGSSCGMASARQEQRRSARAGRSECEGSPIRPESAVHNQSRGSNGSVDNTGGTGLEVGGEQQTWGQRETTERSGASLGLAYSASNGWREGIDGRQAGAQRGSGPSNGGWEGCDWIPCSDGVSRPVEPGTHPLAHGVPARVGKLRAYGNAIVPEVAAAFIRAAMGAT